MSNRVSSSRPFFNHLASDLETVDAERFLEFALADHEQPWDAPAWKAVTDKINADREQCKLKQAWIAAQPETEKYGPFCDWVKTLLTFIDSCPCTLPRQRQIRFTPLGSQNIRCTPGYADGEAVGGTESSFRPDAACVMEAPPSSQPSSSQPSSSRTPPTSKQPDSSTNGSYPNNVRREALSYRFPLDAGSATPSTPSAYTASKDDIQLARYAMETFAAVGDRTHVFGLAVNSDNFEQTDHTIALWYFDRCGAIRSHPLDVNNSEDLGAFIKFLAALVYMTNDALGFNPFFAAPDKPVPELCGMSVDIPNSQELSLASLTLSKVLDRRTSMVGRATLVYFAQSWKRGISALEGADVVLKSSWQHRNRTSERVILEELHADGEARKYIVNFYAGWEQENTRGQSQRAKFGINETVVHDRAPAHSH
ncbi:hypothetical protein M407DRAFT_20610 [Tulasnella calospora MUT 4182]|uniref:Fungal-type protein kinase domain-containing protein n=1 Tax=Tulasnella calospora MUT 4182 TaxID=1051891 RepID=A0A0C3L958_9AGAM|nr:hypothetical protein M407DRAFT_20610 [Tulasnella calospora MUT 4182]